MNDSFPLSGRQRDLLIELLEAERRNLPTEIRHTDAREFHDNLVERMKLVDELLDCLHKYAAVT